MEPSGIDMLVRRDVDWFALCNIEYWGEEYSKKETQHITFMKENNLLILDDITSSYPYESVSTK